MTWAARADPQRRSHSLREDCWLPPVRDLPCPEADPARASTYRAAAEVNAIVAERTAQVPTLETDFPRPACVESVATLNRNLGAQPVMPGNRVDLFPGYADSIAAMTAEVDRAATWVHVEFTSPLGTT
jgi:hypothetical protein